MQAKSFNRRPWNLWSRTGRSIAFILAATSIACLLADFYRLCPMREFTLFIFLPALAGLAALSLADLIHGDRQLWRGVGIGVASGLLAALAYDLFRLPFVFATTWGIDSMVAPLNLFKVFPAFGAMILGQTAAQTHYALAAHLTGWAYHFSNGMTFGVMFVAMLGEVTKSRWIWAVAMAAGLELGICIFGIVMGLAAHGMTSRWQIGQQPPGNPKPGA
ncbi:MAG: hypothetical protein DME22_04365 [Verrucomicrobia bacterium]|nr:MAG: hypothetical protein DME22_04365 [Verrucomicrobiota bacterium]